MPRLGPSQANSWEVGAEEVDLVRPLVPPRRCRVTAQPRNLVFDLNRTGVVVVDMQKDFCAPGGWFHARGNDITPLLKPVPVLQRLLPAMRAAGATVFWLNWGNRADVANLPPSVVFAGNPSGREAGYGDMLPDGSGPVLVRGAAGAEVIDALTVEPADVTVHKTRFSGFPDSELDSVLRNRQITTLLFTGINIDRCVFATLMDASFLGYDCILVEDACSTPSEDYCTEAVLFLVKKLYGFVTTSTALVEGLQRA